MEQRDYAKDLPVEPPEGIIQWLKEQGKFRFHALWYKAARVADPLSGEREKMAELHCSGCGGTMYASRMEAGGCHTGYQTAPFGFLDPETKKAVISGNTINCPMCGEPAKVFHVSAFRNGTTLEEQWPMAVMRLEDKLALVGWSISQFADRESGETFVVHPYEAYVVEERKVVRLMGYMKCLSSISFFNRWEQRKTCLDNWGAAPLVYPWDPDILKGTTAENSKLDLYMKRAKTKYPVTYLRLWQRHRNLENLVMQGCSYLVGEMIEEESHRYSYERAKGVPKLEGVNWKEQRPSKMLGLSGETFRYCRDMRWDPSALRFYRTCQEKGVKLKLPDDMTDCMNAGVHWCWRIQEEGLPMLRCVRYLKKQKLLDKRVDKHTLDDYWAIARQEGYDLNDEHIFFPKNLMQAHDRVMQEQRIREEAKRKKQLEEQNRSLKEKFRLRLEILERFSWAQNGILIRPCGMPEELDAEGKMLNHCVATYKNVHAAGKKAIFFIRREKEPDKPWYTLELDVENLTVVQNRGKCNCARTKQVEEFERAWLEHIRTIGKSKKKRGNVA